MHYFITYSLSKQKKLRLVVTCVVDMWNFMWNVILLVLGNISFHRINFFIISGCR